MGSSRVDGGFSPRLGPRTASAPAPNSPPSLPDDQYLDGRDPSLLARWNTLGGPEKQQLQEVLCKLRRPADDFVRIPFPLIATAGSGAAAVAAAAREYDREAKVVDPRLFRKVTLQDKGIALSDLCAELQSQTGVQFRASRSVADEKATVFVKEERARDVMRAISHLFGYPWVRSSRDGEYRYELDQDLRSQLAEEELRNRDRDAALLALDGEMQKYRSYLEMSVEELQRRVHQAGEQRDQKVSSLLVPMALNGGWGGVQLYHRLTPRERSDLADGREIVLRSDAPNPDRRLPAAWNRPILESWNGGTEDGGSRVNQVRLKLNRSELGQVSLISTISVVSPGTRSYTDEEIATGRNPSAANPDNSIANQPLRGQSPFDQIVSIIPNPSSPADKNYRRMEMDLDLDLVFFNFDLSKPHAVSADAWEAVHRATGLPIVADFYTRLYPASKLTVDRKPLFDALCSLGDTLGARWRKDGGFLLCRSTSYFWDKLKEVPNRHLQRWSRDRDANGGLPFSDLLEMAAMPDQQLDPTSVAEGIEHYWKLPEWGLITSPYYRHRARFLSTLAPDQLQRSFKEEGIPFAELTPAQQRGAMQMQREALGEVEREGGGPTQIPPELWTHAFVTVKYIPAGWYAWIPPRAVRNGLWRGPSGPFGGRAAQEALAQARRFYPPASPQDVQFSRGGYLRVSLWLQR